MDGTLLNSLSVWDTIGEDYLRSLGYEPGENLKEALKNMSLYQAACYYQREYGVTLSTDEIMNGVNAMLERFYRHAGFMRQTGGTTLCRLIKIMQRRYDNEDSIINRRDRSQRRRRDSG